MNITAKVDIPKDLLGTAEMKTAISNALKGAALGVQNDMRVTTQTWNHKPDFKITKDSDWKYTVGTDDTIYGYVNNGTPPHKIYPVHAKMLRFMTGGFQAKTQPGVIGSTAGSQGSTEVMAHAVNHPGTEARKFDEVILKKWDDELPKILQRAVDSLMK